jgi:hypothetical protein
VILNQRNRDTVLIGMCLLVSGSWAAVISGGEGVDVNAIFDFVILLCIAGAIAVDYINRWASVEGVPGYVFQCTVMMSLALPVLLKLPLAIIELRTAVVQLDEERANAAAGIDLLRRYNGHVMCENLALCYWAGKAFEVDVFNTGQKFFKGVLKETALLEPIDAQRYAVIQLDHEGGTSRLPTKANNHISAFYRTERVIKKVGVFLVPIPSKESSGLQLSIQYGGQK